ncbi:S8 family peptidase [Actinokineospora xionganensis]|uniref:S8 family peptidase n=1 Tax=Actinokineospora xionganensis TaxID=2684470 RepID=A0ABR7LAR7_9PSEU|nr:S8 family peptidase [Actinokineospora xionganensis]MBC6449481.1 S8 family peptidase [Actinokineospora xionganensis]
MKRTISLAIAIGLVAAGSTAATAEPPKPPTNDARAVTLITGDRVLLSAGRPAVLPGKGRERITFRTYTAGGRLNVIPADALPLISSGKLDPRLFDVTGLLDAGYGDGRGDLPLILTGPTPRSAGVRTVRELPSAGARAVAAEKSSLGESWRALAAGPGKVWLDARHKANLDRSTAQIGAPAAWQAGLTGDGVTVAVLDTGVDQTHPDLAGREIGERNFTDSADAVDRMGHGTHVGSTIAGGGAKYQGVAHGAKLLDGKVLSDQGWGQESWIIAGMEWAAEQGADIVNLSLGGEDTAEVDPLEAAVNRLTADHGTLFVIAAGNSGPSAGTVGSPGSADAALTVGSVERDDALSFFSSRGPRVGDGAIKPDVTAPGSDIVAAQAKEGVIGSPVEPGYVSMSGTSMATPHVAGAAALLAQKNPQWTAAQLKAALTASARPTPQEPAYAQGSGRIDVPRALAQNVTSEPTSVGFGVPRWPHGDDEPVTKEITYRNGGTAPVTLDLKVDFVGPDGKPAPAGMIALSRDRVEVPAGGTATVGVTSDTRLGSVDGTYSGTVVATSGESATRTPVGVDREVESYDVKTTFLGLDGKPSPNAYTLVFALDTGQLSFIHSPGGVVTRRMPKGRYLVDTFFAMETGSHVVTEPAFTLTKDTETVVDARVTKQLKVVAPDPAAVSVLASAGYEFATETGWISVSALGDSAEQIHTAHVGPELPADKFLWTLSTSWMAGKDFYGLVHFQPKSVPTGLEKTYRPADVATVRTALGQPTAKATNGIRLTFPRHPDGRGSSWAIGREVSLPGGLTEHFSTENTEWESEVMLGEPPAIQGSFRSVPKSLRAGRTYQERMAGAIFSPALPRSPYPWAERVGDDITFGIGLFGDGAGNAGSTVVTSGKTTLHRDGVQIGEGPGAGYGMFPVPAEQGAYRLATEGVRGELFDVSTKVSAAWTFTSAAGDKIIPLSVLRFHGVLDESNSARAGRPFLLPVGMRLEDGSTVTPRKLGVEVSYDEGKTWRRATVANNTALLLHPADAKSVSLRAKAEDGRGATVEQTIIRAYKLK